MSKQKLTGAERRRAKRVLVQESFSIFVVVPAGHGLVRLYMRDLSRLGLCFDCEIAGSFKAGQEFALRLHVNPGFYLPLEAKVVRVQNLEVACEFKDPEGVAVQSVAKLLDFLDIAAEAGVLGA